MGIIGDTIKAKLTKSFNPSHLEVIDESYKHAGHAGAAAHAADNPGRNDRESAESHFHVVITSEAFAGMSRLARHRAVMDALGDLMKSKVHALSVEFK